MTQALWGPELLAADRTRFRLWAPAREAVSLEIDGGGSLRMTRAADGWFAVEAEVGAGTRYRFRLADDLAVPDPASRQQADTVHGWSVVVDPAAYRWHTTNWRGRPWEETVIYEAHAGLAGGFAGLTEQLETLGETGITALEIMPVAAFSGARNWGYDGVLPYAPATAYGSPDDCKALIDRAHGLGLMVFLDVVYNHFGPDGNYLGTYCPDFFDESRHTPWGSAIAFGRDEVARYFIDNARMWIEEYRFDGLRLDAVQAIGDDAFLDRLATEVRAGAGERHVHIVLENERNDARRLVPGKYDGQWNDDFHNVVHVLLTGEDQSYYGDFAYRPAEGLAKCLAEGFIYQGQESANLGYPRGTPSADLPPTRFVSFLQNHDQVGNRAMGERLITLADPAKLRAATALLMLMPQIPMLFMGEEIGSNSRFLFFTDFRDDLADAVREGRRHEFAKFPAFADPGHRAKIPDPNALATFEASKPQPGSESEAWRTFYRSLLTLRRERIIPGLSEAKSIGTEVLGDKAVSARWRLGDGAKLTLALNLGDEPIALIQPGCNSLFATDGAWDGKLLAPASLAAWLDQA